MESILAQVNSGCAVDRHNQRAAWCPGGLVSALVFLDTSLVKWLDDSLKITVGYKCKCAGRHENNHNNRDSKNTYQLTTMKCQLFAFFSSSLFLCCLFFLLFSFFSLCFLIFLFFSFPGFLSLSIFLIFCFLFFSFFLFSLCSFLFFSFSLFVN